MTKEQIFEFMNKAGFFHIATLDGGKPRVRAIMLYSAGEDGIMFHTGTFKDLYGQLDACKDVELCFNDIQGGVQVRAFGSLTEITDIAVKDTIINHPSRAFLQGWKNSMPIDKFYQSFKVYNLKHADAVVWTMATNNAPKTVIKL